jgi:hypothetical protein
MMKLLVGLLNEVNVRADVKILLEKLSLLLKMIRLENSLAGSSCK